MPKALCVAGIVVAALLIVFFGFDLALGIPFGRSIMIDFAFMLCAGALGYLGWSALREQM